MHLKIDGVAPLMTDPPGLPNTVFISFFNAVFTRKSICHYLDFFLVNCLLTCRFLWVFLTFCICGAKLGKKVILIAEILLAVFGYNHETGSFSMVTQYYRSVGPQGDLSYIANTILYNTGCSIINGSNIALHITTIDPQEIVLVRSRNHC